MSKKTAVLLIGFGGPTRLEEVRPFLQSIVGEARMPTERIEEVYRHYELIGGASPFNAITDRQRAALEEALRSKGHALPVAVAYRHSNPSFRDAFEGFKKYGVENVIGLVLASFRSFVSREWYHDKVAEGRESAGASSIEVRYASEFEIDPLYLQAQLERIGQITSAWSAGKKHSTYTIFTAHSIPSAMCEKSCSENENRCYGYQFYEACVRVARDARIQNWTYCYQSQAGSPRDRWLDPDVKQVIQRIDASRFKRVLLVPIGFLCDNVEVIYDLDREAQAAARQKEIDYFRAETVGDHPLFIEMMAGRVLEQLAQPVGR